MRIGKLCVGWMFACLSLFFPFLLRATGQAGDVLRMDSAEWDLMAKPIEEDSALRARLHAFLPEERSWTTGNWSGYTAYWYLRHDTLFLEKIEVCMFDKEQRQEYQQTFMADTLSDLFDSYLTPCGEIYAGWLTCKLRAGFGELVWYVHDGFVRNHETEVVFTFDCGKIIHRQTYHNSMKEGMDLREAWLELAKRFPWERFPEYRNDRLIFVTRRFEVTSDGHFAGGSFSAKVQKEGDDWIDDQEHPLIRAFKETLSSIYPWRVYYLNGRYTIGIERMTLPLRERSSI